VNLTDRQRYFELFFSGCLAITAAKGPDYNPDNIPLMDVLETAVDLDTGIPHVLWTYYRKHATAIRRHCIDGMLESEPVMGRLQDAANYLAMLSFYEAYKQELHAVWRKHWAGQSCECARTNPMGILADICPRDKTLLWLERRAFAIGSDPTSSHSTPKARG
jgi:hypothetical protein